MSLPDKANENDKEAANKKFQEIALAYAILSDDRRRKRFDLTGSTAETLEDDDEFDWLKFYREQWEDVVNEEAIKRVSDEYKGSAEERQDLIQAYTKAKGNLHAVYELVMLSDILEDDDRFRQILDEEIQNGTIESYPKYAKETDVTRQKAKDAERKRREDFEKRQAKETEEEDDDESPKPKGKAKSKPKKKSPGDIGDLAALIQQRQKSRAGNFFDQLEAKYAPKSRGSKRSTPMDEPSEEAFQATAARKKQKSNGRSKKARAEDEDEMDLDEEDIGAPEEDEEDEEDEDEEVKPRKTKAKTKVKGRGRVRTKA